MWAELSFPFGKWWWLLGPVMCYCPPLKVIQSQLLELMHFRNRSL